MSQFNNDSTAELYTVVENLTGGERVFAFLGPRGYRLAAGEAIAIPGDLIASLGGLHQSGGRRRKFDALERALKAGDLQINNRPAPILFDHTAGAPVSLSVDNGSLGTVDPTYDSDDSNFAAV